MAVVLDLDGVILDSEQVWDEVRRGLVEERGARWAADSQRVMMGMSTAEWSTYLTRELGLPMPAG
ncbi:MAG TPA: HAD family phosphatase, partial [Frankiaceae bacterium]|nr:HAD family phosphatase [Frankiaceae bacterium]